MMYQGILKDKVVFISGGNSGIGAACAKKFALHGAKIIIIARRMEESHQVIEEIESQDGMAEFIQVDVSDQKAIEKAINETVHRYGRLDIAINNAGIVGPVSQSITDYEEVDFLNVMNINVTAVYIAMKHQIRIMKKQNYGVIINMSSIAGLKAGRASFAYTASKHAVTGMTRAVAKEVAAYGIRVNAICPALVETPMLVDGQFYQGRPIAESIPVGRLGKPDEVAETALWLSSDHSSYITGIAVPVDGGICA